MRTSATIILALITAFIGYLIHNTVAPMVYSAQSGRDSLCISKYYIPNGTLTRMPVRCLFNIGNMAKYMDLETVKEKQLANDTLNIATNAWRKRDIDNSTLITQLIISERIIFVLLVILALLAIKMVNAHCTNYKRYKNFYHLFNSKKLGKQKKETNGITERNPEENPDNGGQ